MPKNPSLFEKITDIVVKPSIRLSKNPFIGEQKLIVHCCYHKVGTHWFSNILRSIAKDYGLWFQLSKQDALKKKTNIFFQDHSEVDLSILPPYRGSHMTRDPRDMVISGYFYHLWTDEEWASKPHPQYNGLSYQEMLKGLSEHDGILAEIKRSNRSFIEMAAWNYNNPDMFEIKYEDIILDEMTVFQKMFEHYGFNKEAVEKSLTYVEQFSFKNIAKRDVGEKKQKSHLRSGKPGEWMEIFTNEHKDYFKELNGDALVKIGYEKDNMW